MLNQSLPGILKNLEEITTNINKATHTVNEQIDGLISSGESAFRESWEW